MNLTRAITLASIVIATHTAAHAQLSVYGTFTDDNYTYTRGHSAPSVASTQSAAGGFTVGVAYDFHVVKDLYLGPDIRGGVNPANPGSNTRLASVKFTYNPQDSIPRLYAEFGVGGLHGHTPALYSSGVNNPPTAVADSTIFQTTFGFDIKCPRGIDIRLLEVAFDSDTSNPSASNLGISAVTYSFGVAWYIPQTAKRRRY